MTMKNIKLINNMNSFFKLVFLGLLFVACGTDQSSQDPNDLQGLRASLTAKQKELKQLSDEIDAIQLRISELDTTEKTKRLVTVDTIVQSDFKHFVDVQGTIQSDEIVNVSPEAPGRIIRLLIKEGQSVSRGQLIAQLDMESTQKQMEEIETALSLAQTVYERQSRLWEQKIGSEIQYLEAKNSKERLEKSLSTLKTQMNKASIYAPTSGVIERLLSQEGEYGSPGMPIAMIVNTNKIKIQADIPEIYVGKVRKGEQVKVYFPTLDQEITTTITMVGKTISSGNRTFRIEAMLPGVSNELYKPNLLALVKISDFEKKDAIQIPVKVVQQEASGKHFILLMEESSQGPIATKAYIKIGKSYDNNVVIEEGLQKGQIYILEGARGLANNELIEIANP